MTTTLYFVRHGETDYNRRRIVQGRRINSRLNATGQEQARRLAERFASVPLTAIYASAQTRAVETAQAVALYHPRLSIHTLADLEEMSWGTLEGAPASLHTRDTFSAIYAQWEAGDFEAQVPEGESIRDVQTRALRAYHRIVGAQQGGTVLVVAHGRLLRVLLASILPGYGLARMHDIHHANTSVNKITVIAEQEAEACLLNCTTHLNVVTATLVE